MRIGELARRVGVSTDAVRFYERSGLLPRPARLDNDYREYGETDVEHLRLLTDLRRLDLPLAEAAQVAAWCHSGHCGDTTDALPSIVAARRAEIAGRIEGLRALDERLADLERHLAERPQRPLGKAALPVLAGPCCDAAAAIVGSAESTCACCSTAVN
jgi:DNA-binding transcriptional MerR regulator